jgi:hypothetical protein
MLPAPLGVWVVSVVSADSERPLAVSVVKPVRGHTVTGWREVLHQLAAMS